MGNESVVAGEERFRALAVAAPVGIVQADARWRILGVNRRFLEITGRAESEILGPAGRWLKLIHPDDHPVLAEEREAAGSEDREIVTECRVVRPDGELRWVRVRGASIRDHTGFVTGYISTVEDVTEWKRAEEARRDSEERFRSAFEHAPIGMGLATKDGRIFGANQAFARMLGREPVELVGMSIRDLTHPDDWEHNAELIERLFRQDVAGYGMEKRYLHADGHVVWASLSVSLVRDASGEASYMIAQVQDIDDRRAMLERLEHQALHDSLTGLPNRVQVIDRLSKVRRRRGAITAVLFLDVDRFKVHNDTLGHHAGDQLLIDLARRLRAKLRPEDLVARLGGDEFVLVCDGLDSPAAAYRAAQRVLEIVQEPFRIGGSSVVMTASIGIALVESQDPEAPLRDADAAMYLAKEHGRARAELFDESLRARTHDRFEVEHDLRQALERDQLVLHYQPAFQITTGALLGFEALLRWAHPTRGLLEPKDFLGIAEETGLIHDIGSWALEIASRQTTCWQTQHPEWGQLFIGVNVSARELADPTFVGNATAIIDRTGIDPATLVIELTETAFLAESTSTENTLRAIQQLGVHLALDDFGTGYSSLLHLKRFPIETVKIDRDFIRGLTHNPEDEAIVASIIDLAHALDLFVVAEGIETAAQARRLTALGCHIGQGHHWAPALPPHQLEQRLAHTHIAGRARARLMKDRNRQSDASGHSTPKVSGNGETDRGAAGADPHR
jgi:diguanylate cyclase (GGDEF)-like protein/PAS domain S-box-containing protein